MAQLHSLKTPRLPAAVTETHKRRANVTRQRQDQAQRVLGHRGGAVIRRIGNDHAALRGSLHINVIPIANAEKADELEQWALLQHLGIQHRVVEDHRFCLTHSGHQLRLITGQLVVKIDWPKLFPGLKSIGDCTHAAPSGKTIRMLRSPCAGSWSVLI